MRHLRVMAIAMALTPLHAADVQSTPTWEELTAAGKAAFQEKRFDDAERHFAAALEAAEQSGPADARLAASLSNLAAVHFQNRKEQQALPLYLRALKAIEELPDRNVPALVAVLEALSESYWRLGNPAKAAPWLERLVAAYEDDPAVSKTDLVGLLQRISAQYYQAAPSWPEFRRLDPLAVGRRSGGGPEPPGSGISGAVMTSSDRARIATSRMPPSPPDMVPNPNPRTLTSTYSDLARPGNLAASTVTADSVLVMRKRGTLLEVAASFREREVQVRAAMGPRDAAAVASHHLLADMHRDLGNLERAEAEYRLVAQELEHAAEEDKLVEALVELAVVQYRRQDLLNAESNLRRAIEVAEKQYGPQARGVAYPLFHYAWFLTETDRESEAKKLKSRLGRLLKKKP